MTVERIARLLTTESVLCYPLPDFPCLWIPSFPLPSLCLPCRVASSIRGKDGVIFSWPIASTLAQTVSVAYSAPFAFLFIISWPDRHKEFSACWAHFSVSKFPHRRFYSSLPVTLPTLPFCSSPVARSLCGSKDSWPSGIDLVCFFSNSLTQKKKSVCVS